MALFVNPMDEAIIAFLRDAAKYFRALPTNGEDLAYWANEANAERLEFAAQRLEELT